MFCFDGAISGMPKLPQRFLISLLWCLLCGASSSTVAGEYVFSRWLTEHGLPQNSVYSILQTRDGYLWLTTLDGLVRFDGLRFTVFDKSNTKGLITNRFIRLFEARDGSLWIVTEDDGLALYNDGKFTSFTTNDGLPGKDVRVVRDDSEGNVWIFTTAGLAGYKDGRLFYRPPYDTVPYNLSFRNWFGVPSFSDKTGLHVFNDGRYTTD